MIPIGGIALWSGGIVDIPDGWQLCDGTNGTPDLRNKFVVGSGDTYAVDETGGALTHDHTFVGDGHVHTATSIVEMPDTSGSEVWDAGSDTFTTNSSTASGDTELASSLPPFFSLAYIQRMV